VFLSLYKKLDSVSVIGMLLPMSEHKMIVDGTSHNLAHGIKSIEDRNKLATMSQAPKEPMMNTFERAVKNSSQDRTPEYKTGNSS